MVPAFRVEADSGNLLANGFDLTRRLNLLILVEISSRGKLGWRIGGIAAARGNRAQRKQEEV